jgi:hypothetical protein
MLRGVLQRNTHFAIHSRPRFGYPVTPIAQTCLGKIGEVHADNVREDKKARLKEA